MPGPWGAQQQTAVVAGVGGGHGVLLPSAGLLRVPLALHGCVHQVRVLDGGAQARHGPRARARPSAHRAPRRLHTLLPVAAAVSHRGHNDGTDRGGWPGLPLPPRLHWACLWRASFYPVRQAHCLCAGACSWCFRCRCTSSCCCHRCGSCHCPRPHHTHHGDRRIGANNAPSGCSHPCARSGVRTCTRQQSCGGLVARGGAPRGQSPRLVRPARTPTVPARGTARASRASCYRSTALPGQATCNSKGAALVAAGPCPRPRGIACVGASPTTGMCCTRLCLLLSGTNPTRCRPAAQQRALPAWQRPTDSGSLTGTIATTTTTTDSTMPADPSGCSGSIRAFRKRSPGSERSHCCHRCSCVRSTGSRGPRTSSP